MSIILAAMAPVVTTRNKIDNSSPWRYSPQNASNAYFGAGQAMHALIGQVEATENDNGKLVINTLGSTMSHILFKSNNDVLGGLYLSGSSIVLGNRRNDSQFTYKKDPTKEPHVGVIAQDLQKVFPNAVKKGADGFLTIRMEDMFYAVINAIKELDSRVTALEKENKELKTRLDKLEAKIK